ncbi:MAG: DNRLRE domain-containing protein [Planctomycetes bacterium]|nr:DNRLRE domain-containing protein [Planctomycetota bacterium]
MKTDRLTVYTLLFVWWFFGAHVVAGGPSTGNTPLTDLGAGVYQGFTGGLYPGGINSPPAAHAAAAASMAQQIVPRSGTGVPDAGGWIVLLSIGMSNTCHEFSVFERQEDAGGARNARVVLVNGAIGGWSAAMIADPNAPYWQAVSDRLAVLGLTSAQVQAVWLKEANSSPPNDFPGHALQLKADLRTIVQSLYGKFPNLRLCYLSSRIYGGYAGAWEPQAYETGFSVKWLIEDQIGGADPGLNYDAQAGPVEAPLLLWGPYLWADGVVPRSDGLTWQHPDLESDGVHPAPSGEQKAADLLSTFFASEASAQPWYVAQPGVTLVTLDAEADAYVQTAAPTTNFGTAPELQVQGGAAPIRSYLRFDASAVSAPILLAKLSLRVTTGGVGGGTVSLVNDSSWSEGSITANNAPAVGAAVATVPQSTRDGTIAADVTAELTADADEVISFAHADALAGLRVYHSREAGQPPRLVLVVADPAAAVPAVSGGGLALTAVLLLTAGALVLRRQRAAPGWRAAPPR